MQPALCSCCEGDCNDCWNEQVFSRLGLPLVWKRDGMWVLRHEREQLGWYAYCDRFSIPWPYPRLLPHWAIANMDDQHEYDVHFDGDLYPEENDRKYHTTQPEPWPACC